MFTCSPLWFCFYCSIVTCTWILREEQQVCLERPVETLKYIKKSIQTGIRILNTKRLFEWIQTYFPTSPQNKKTLHIAPPWPILYSHCPHALYIGMYPSYLAGLWHSGLDVTHWSYLQKATFSHFATYLKVKRKFLYQLQERNDWFQTTLSRTYFLGSSLLGACGNQNMMNLHRVEAKQFITLSVLNI